MSDEELLTAGALRALGHFIPPDVPDDVPCRLTKRLDADSETLHVTVDAYPVAQIESVNVTVRIS